LFGCPLLETTHRAPPTSKGIIQRAPRDVQKMRKRGGAPCAATVLAQSRAP
jgi:predicted PP-loop superfamily ATPase